MHSSTRLSAALNPDLAGLVLINAVGTYDPAAQAFLDFREIVICASRAASGCLLLAAELPEMSRYR
jgi:hypothetical protein